MVDLTVGGDKATTLRFLGWLHATHDIMPVSVSSTAALSQWAEEYAKALAEKGLKYSSIANYLNGLAMVCQYSTRRTRSTPTRSQWPRRRSTSCCASADSARARPSSSNSIAAATPTGSNGLTHRGLGRAPRQRQSTAPRRTTRAQAAGAQRVVDRVPRESTPPPPPPAAAPHVLPHVAPC